MDDETSGSDITIPSKSQIDPLDFRVCKKFFTSGCEDSNCLQKHTLYLKDIVCKYILLYGYCYKGPKCPFIHEVLQEKLPECKNQTSTSRCANPNCKFKHRPTNNSKECVFYNKGFCKMGKFCKFKHIRRKLCRNESEIGVCEEGCEAIHLSDLAQGRVFEEILEEVYYRMHPDRKKVNYEDFYRLCFRCMQFGHNPKNCEKLDRRTVLRCYKCFEYGHKSNRCQKNNKIFS